MKWNFQVKQKVIHLLLLLVNQYALYLCSHTRKLSEEKFINETLEVYMDKNW